jgi:hypothetical protein
MAARAAATCSTSTPARSRRPGATMARDGRGRGHRAVHARRLACQQRLQPIRRHVRHRAAHAEPGMQFPDDQRRRRQADARPRVTFTTLTNGGGTVIIGQSGTGSTIVTSAGSTTVNGTTKTGTLTCTGGKTNTTCASAATTIGVLNLDGGDFDLQRRREPSMSATT